MQLNYDIHYYIEDSILFGYSDKLKKPYKPEEMQNNQKENFDNNNIYRTSSGEPLTTNPFLPNSAASYNPQIYPGVYTHPAFGTITIVDYLGELQFSYGQDVEGYLVWTGIPYQFVLFMHEGSTFWHMTMSDGQVIL